MSGEQDRLDAAVRQEIAAGRDGYTAGRDMTVIYQHRDNRASALHEKRRGRDRAIIGQLITEITDPHDLEIHPSIDVPDSSAPGSVLLPYIPRTHDRVLRKLVKMAIKEALWPYWLEDHRPGRPVLAGKRYVHSPGDGGYGTRSAQRVQRRCGRHSKTSLLGHEQSFGFMKLNFTLTLNQEGWGNGQLQVCGT